MSIKTQHIMLDLETMGINPNAAIVSIGAVAFDPKVNEILDEIYIIIDLESSVNKGGIMDASTVLWWMRQDDSARLVFNDFRSEMHEALFGFYDFLDSCSDYDTRLIYGNGSDFDNVILDSAYKRMKIPTPWKYYNNRCYRTLKNLRPDIQLERTGTHHNALDDAKCQAIHLMKIMDTFHAN